MTSGAPGKILTGALALASAFTISGEALAHEDEFAHQRAVQEITKAAQALLAELPKESGFIERLFGYSQRERAMLAWEDKARADWSYWPRSRAGLNLGQMTARQRNLTQDLLASILSSKGHLKLVQIMQLEEILRALEMTNFPRHIEDYSLVFFGQPSMDAPWSLRFEGHHVSLNITLTPSEISVTPSFLGASPSVVPSGPLAGLRVLRLEEEFARKLVQSLSEEQRCHAIQSDKPPGEILSSQFQKEPREWGDWKRAIRADGLPALAMDQQQRILFRDLIEEIVTTYRAEIANHYLDELDLSRFYFAWMGGTEPGAPHYYRVQGPAFLFEYDNVQGNAQHIHTVWRDRGGIMGEDILRRHYADSHLRARDQ